MVAYLHKGIIGVFELAEAHSDKYVIGKTIEDYDDGKWIELNDEQIEFYRKNPNASAREIIEMKLNVYPTLPEQTLEEFQESMITYIKQVAINRLQEAFPQHEINRVALGLANERETATFVSNYALTTEEINRCLTDMIKAIEKSSDRKEVEANIVRFNESIDREISKNDRS